MNASILDPGIKKIAIIDDEEDWAKLTAMRIRRLGVEPIIIKGNFQQVHELVDRVLDSGAHAAICDNCLQQKNFAEFYGAESVAQWYDRKLPSVLCTQYLDQDNIEIRQYLSRIPRVLKKTEASSEEAIVSCLNFCLEELQGEISPERQTCRTLVKVKRITDSGSKRVMDVIVPSWDLNDTVRLPMSWLHADIEKHVTEGTRLFAWVNTGAEDSMDLFFQNFELALDPLTEDELDQLYNP